MQIKKILPILLIAVALLGVASFATVAQAAPSQQAATVTLKVLNPQGAIPAVGKLAPRLSTLDGKKVALWLMLPNTFEFQPAGKAFYDRIAELLKQQFPNVTLVMPDKLENSSDAAKSLAGIKDAKPDAAILALGG